MEGIQIPEIYINSDMILSFDEESCNWNETSGNLSNSPKILNTNIQNTSNKLNVNVNVNVNGNVNYSHSSSKCNFNTNNVSEEVNASEYSSKFPEIPRGNTSHKKIQESIPFSQEETSKSIIIDCLLKDQSQFKIENQYAETSQSPNLLSYTESNLIEKVNSDKFRTVDKESNMVRRRRGDPKLCWRCHKRDATPHMRSCEPCRVADRQRWSRRRNLSKIISGKSGANTHADHGFGYFNSQLKDDLSISLSSENSKLDAFHGGYIQSGIQLKCDNQYISGAHENFRTLNAGISHPNNSAQISSFSLGYPFKMDQWRDQQQPTSFKENRTSHPCTEISQNLSYITISYFPSSFSGLTTLPVCAKFASDGSMNGLETLPSVVLSFIVDKCNEQLLQRQLGRQSHQNLISNNTQCNSQVESGLGNNLINNAEVNKNINGTGGLGSFHNFHCNNIHSNTLDSRFYC
ncbi:uncharacterized protein ELE39_001973 [Cryptosporidium sp. chipmunk genotype I]|uniref:uncharacterized protein n=1 Tax=Cryptosporidium sp. chipmunk genotype I TaxID=1280935 RepID=UPI00351A097E|nr:hypothetical protein ELE39_001973 [Cryptosporidium sp. chipmunk genotype I]